jgi:hypothetical protein
MTDATTAAEAVFVPRGRPVARFVGAIAALSAVLVIVWASGLFSPRLELAAERVELSAVGSATIRIRSQSPASARVKVLDVSDAYVRLTRPIPEVRVDRDQTVRLTVHYAVDCAGYEAAVRTPPGATEPRLRLVIRARGPIGPGRRFTWPDGAELSLQQACPSPGIR